MAKRIEKRKLKIWHTGYLVYKYLWKNIENAVYKAKKNLQNSFDKKLQVLDVGCGNKPYADLFEDCDYLGLDYNLEDTKADIVGSAMKIPLEDSTFDIVFSTQVIEHVSSPNDMIAEIYRVLKPGGYLILSGPMYWPHHEIPHDYFRFTKYGFAELLKRNHFSEYDIKPDGGTWAQIFISIVIQVPRWLFLLRIPLNLMGAFIDKVFYNDISPANFTILAKK